jgi:hypothetical protein
VDLCVRAEPCDPCLIHSAASDLGKMTGDLAGHLPCGDYRPQSAISGDFRCG